MAATPISKFSVPHSNAGYNLAGSSDFTTLGIGSGNGVTFAWNSGDSVYLKNTTGGTATFTLKFAPQTALTGYGGSVTNATRTVPATTGLYIMRLDSQFQDASGNVTIECDVAGSVLVINA